MEKFNSNGKEPREIKIVDEIYKSFREGLKDFTEGDLIIKKIEGQELEDNLIFTMRFKGGGNQIFEIVDNFYKENKDNIERTLRTKDFGIVLDGNTREFIAQIVLAKDASQEEKQKARDILEKLKQKLHSI